MMKSSKLGFVIGVAFVFSAGISVSAAFDRSKPDDGAFSGPSGGDVVYSQLDDPSGSAFVDQSFEVQYAAYDSTGADDFAVKGLRLLFISTINTAGSVTVPGSNPFFVNNAFWSDAGGEPGAVLADCDFPGNTNFTSAGDGDLSIEVDCTPPYGAKTWVSQSVRMDFNPFGQHFWATRATAAGSPAVWRNPGNGFGSGCLDWEPANAVCGQVGQDMLFELIGGYHPELDWGVPAAGPLGTVVMILALGAGSAYVLRRRRDSAGSARPVTPA